MFLWTNLSRDNKFDLWFWPGDLYLCSMGLDILHTNFIYHFQRHAPDLELVWAEKAVLPVHWTRTIIGGHASWTPYSIYFHKVGLIMLSSRQTCSWWHVLRYQCIFFSCLYDFWRIRFSQSDALDVLFVIVVCLWRLCFAVNFVHLTLLNNSGW